MDRLLIALALAGVAVVVALVVARRGADRPTAAPVQHSVPSQLDRNDFTGPERPWLVAVFTSASCSTCSAVAAAAGVLESDQVAVQELEVGAQPELHARYDITAVPVTLLADADGVVGRSFLGPVSATHLWAAMAELREPGSTPSGCGDDADDD